MSDFGHLRSVKKEIARIALASPKTVEGWVQEVSLPGLESFMRILPHSPSLQAMVRRLSGMQADLHEDLTREISALVQKALQR